jgi:uncharacterized metal-binding protein YceD (DUF177 family)
LRALPVISRTVDVAMIGAAAATKRLELGEHERTLLASALGLLDIHALTVEIELRRDRERMVHLDGRLTAEIVQACVVSLEPVRQTIDEPIALRFVEDDSGAQAKPGTVDIALAGDDPPEVLSGSLIDLGPVMVEHFLLAIDPYPRAPGAEPPENPARERAETLDSPFSALAPLAERGPAER